MFTSVRVFRLNNLNLTNQGLNKIFTDLCENLLKVNTFSLYTVIVLHIPVLSACPWSNILNNWIACISLVTCTCYYAWTVEFVLQAAVDDPLLSMSPELHCGHT